MTEDLILAQAIQKTDPGERASFLDAACAGDERLRTRVEQLLRTHFQSDTTSGARAADPRATDAYTPTPDAENDAGVAAPGHAAGSRMETEDAGKQVGPYKLVRMLGEGGMGAVWMAEQREPVERQVAVKFIKAGMGSADVVARFEAERQALALMDHPNIAKVLDAGTTDGGLPYFVMELVKGISLTQFCDQEHLTPTERVELFIPVCQAVQHAHQKGVLHRDLKPSNLLVGLYDGKPVPKVIDFGLAKAMNRRLTDRTIFTELGQFVGTIEYMSPEQAEPTNLDIDTRADVYSLGVILYELLTGSPPFLSKQLRDAAFTEMLRIIREVEPPRPSTRLSSSGDLNQIAARRKLEPARLTKLIHGELDWIVMKCLEKDRARRYETVNGLALDLQRYLANEPVSAGPPGAAYRVRKFLRRHWVPVAVAGLFLVALAVGAVGTTVGLVEARRQWAAAETARVQEAEQRQRAEQAADLARRNAAATRDVVEQFLVRLGDDRFAEIPGFEPVRQEMLNLAVKRYRDLLRQQPDDDALYSDAAQAFRRSANLYRMTGRTAEARAVYGEAIAAAREVVRKQPASVPYRRRLAETLCDLGTVILRTDGPKAAEPMYREALKTAHQLREESGSDPDVHVFAARTELDLSDVLHERGKDAEALTLARSAAQTFSDLADRPQAKPLFRLLATFAWNNVAQAALGSKQDLVVDEALKEALRRADDGLRLNPRDANMRYTRAWSRLQAGQLGRDKESAKALDESLSELERLVADFPRTATFGRKFAEALTARSRAHLVAGRAAEAADDARKALETLEKLERQPGWTINLDAPFVAALTLAAKAALLQDQKAAAQPLYETARRRLESALAFNPESESTRTTARELEELGRQIGPGE
jgi:serine/threonine protein kinase/tetratricopeptide (TPR) repeat protein